MNNLIKKIYVREIHDSDPEEDGCQIIHPHRWHPSFNCNHPLIKLVRSILQYCLQIRLFFETEMELSPSHLNSLNPLFTLLDRQQEAHQSLDPVLLEISVQYTSNQSFLEPLQNLELSTGGSCMGLDRLFSSSETTNFPKTPLTPRLEHINWHNLCEKE
ncbi:unnamed protein product [Arabis nemorensis]|uniref:Uncharacterized protein n=1 Tax=Arabis nemorensis TaxID=586526 RepID=A0A565ALX3_9BRAS|nr:unnamed protein product [Arabis nemorensis]